MITVKCANCRKKLFRYEKVGKGRLWHLWKERITEDNSVREGSEVRCTCGNLIGIEEAKWIKLKTHSVTYSGSITKN